MTPRILIAGVGNVFLGDDAFGVEVVRRLTERPLPAGVVIRDFGIRGFDLACALQDGYEAAILLDACARGGPPGALLVIEPEADANEPATPVPGLEMHHLDLGSVFRLVRAMGGRLPCLRLIGCEPASLESENESVPCLSEAVRAAVPRAVALVEALTAELLALHRGFPNDRT
jgi:hydrogenase maturation protease